MSDPTACIYSRAQIGLDAPLVRIETHLGPGLPRFSLVGLAETAVREARDRVQSALQTCGFEFPSGRITVNLAPADLPKDGGRFDLGIALSILAANTGLPAPRLAQLEVIGELGLFGEVRPVRGALNAALAAKAASRHLLLPADNCASALPQLPLLPVSHLRQALHLLQPQTPWPSWQPPQCHQPLPPTTLLLDEIRGQALAKRALVIAAAGGHNLLMVGPPGAGKTLLARALPGLLPPLCSAEALEVMQVHAAAGLALPADPAQLQRPFRDPHHQASAAAIIGGGGRVPQPGEISLAHQGVLFLDELPEFNRQVLEALRQPLESRELVLARANLRLRFPAGFQLVAAMNPCPVGRSCEPASCLCSPSQQRQYQRKLSAPLLDRIDLHLQVQPVPHERLLASPGQPEAARLRQQIAQARERQLARQGVPNQQLSQAQLLRVCALSAADRHFLLHAATQLGLSARACHRLLRVARTLADLAGRAEILREDLEEALSYRRNNDSS